MWNLACVLAIKHPAIAFGTYQRIRSFVTFHGIFMGPGYDIGRGSVWRKPMMMMMMMVGGERGGHRGYGRGGRRGGARGRGRGRGGGRGRRRR